MRDSLGDAAPPSIRGSSSRRCEPRALGMTLSRIAATSAIGKRCVPHQRVQPGQRLGGRGGGRGRMPCALGWYRKPGDASDLVGRRALGPGYQALLWTASSLRQFDRVSRIHPRRAVQSRGGHPGDHPMAAMPATLRSRGHAATTPHSSVRRRRGEPPCTSDSIHDE